MQAILAIDQSTSATKALLFDTQGQIIDQYALEHRQIYPQPGWVEHDAGEIYTNVLKVSKALLARHPDKIDQLLCLSITNQRETVVVFEKGTGRPLHNAIVWQCRRGAPLCEELVQAGYQPLVQQKTGLKIDTYFSASKLRWLVDQKADIRANLESGQALIGTIDSYLVYRLTGGQIHATDATNASRTLLFDISRLAWDEDLCEMFHVPMAALPEVRQNTASFGQTDLGGTLEHSIPIIGVMGDSQASLFALRCFTPGDAKVTFGTGSSLLLNIGETLRFSPSGIVSTIAWQLDDQVTYAFEGLINFSAATISWLKNQLQLIYSADETESLALAVENNGGVYLVPAFVGLSAPYWRPDARAAIIGMTPFTTKNHIVRAALESIAYQIKDALDLMTSESSLPLQRINADGGATRNRFLMQFTADMTGYPVCVPDLAELSALGAVYCGYLGSGLVGSLSDIQRQPRRLAEYAPAMNAESVQSLYQGWQAAVQRVL